MGAVQAREGFIKTLHGTEYVVRIGDIVDDSHEVVRTTPADWWQPVAMRFRTEEATAAPGAKRKVAIKVDAPIEADAAQ